MKPGTQLKAAGLAALILCVLSSACGGSDTQTLPAPDVPANEAGRFSLHVLPDSYIDGGSASFVLRQHEEGSEMVLEVLAEEASGLKALYFELAYDAARYVPIEARASGLMSSAAEGGEASLIQLAHTEQPGLLTHGQVLTRWESRSGFSGSGTMARLRFASKPHEAATRTSSAAPTSSLSRTVLSLDGTSLNWGFYSQGDYDQNSEVNISDLTPLGKNFQESVAPQKFAVDSEEGVTDGDENGAINISDITPIGANFKRSLAAYNIYAAADEQSYPQTPDSASALPSIGTLPHGAHQPQIGQGRLRYQFNLPPDKLGLFYWVRPSDGTAEGIASNMIEGIAPNAEPTAAITVDKSIGLPPLLVNFDGSGSSDSDGTIVGYEWDFEGDGTFELDSGTTAQVSHTYESNGTYPAALRVTDDGGATATISRTISVDDSLVAPQAVINVDSQLGDAPFNLTFDGSGSTAGPSGIASYEWDFDGDGSFDASGSVQQPHSYTASGIYFPRLRVTDGNGLSAEQDTVVVVGDGGTFPPASSILAIPYDPTISAGQEARFTVYTYRAENPFKFMNSARLVLPPGVPYVANSLNAGRPGGAAADVDGIWSLVDPAIGMLMPQESFITPVNLQGGMIGYDISITPLGGSQILLATGAMFNIAFTVSEDLSITFQAQDDLKRTYFSDASAFEYSWLHTSNAGMPGISLE